MKYCLAHHKNKQYSKSKFHVGGSLRQYAVVLFTQRTFMTRNRHNPLKSNDVVTIDVPYCTGLGGFWFSPVGDKTYTEIILS